MDEDEDEDEDEDKDGDEDEDREGKEQGASETSLNTHSRVCLKSHPRSAVQLEGQLKDQLERKKVLACSRVEKNTVPPSDSHKTRGTSPAKSD